MIYTGTTGPIGGSEIFGGGAFTMSVAIAGVTVGMSVAVSPRTFPGNGVYWTGYVSAPGVVTVKVGTTITQTVIASIYDVQVNDGTGGGGGTVTAVTGVAPIASTGGNTPAISIALATDLAPGAVQPDGTTITVAGGVISAPGSGVTAVTGTAPIVSSGGATPAISVTAATTGAVGVVKPDGVTIDVAAGVISVPTATTGALGLVKPDGVTIDVAAGVISVPTATTGALGLVKPDGTTITIAGGVISTAQSPGMVQLAQVVLGSNQATVNFTAIPASYTNLILKFMGRNTGSGNGFTVTLNGDTGNNYNSQSGLINNSFNTAAQQTVQSNLSQFLMPGNTATADYAGCGEMEFYSYAGTTFFKHGIARSVLFNNQSNGSLQWMEAALQWASTAAINAILLTSASTSFMAGSVFTLYGLK
jgi:hypothetical protein